MCATTAARASLSLLVRPSHNPRAIDSVSAQLGFSCVIYCLIVYVMPLKIPNNGYSQQAHQTPPTPSTLYKSLSARARPCHMNVSCIAVCVRSVRVHHVSAVSHRIKIFGQQSTYIETPSPPAPHHQRPVVADDFVTAPVSGRHPFHIIQRRVRAWRGRRAYRLSASSVRWRRLGYRIACSAHTHTYTLILCRARCRAHRGTDPPQPYTHIQTQARTRGRSVAARVFGRVSSMCHFAVPIM